MKDEDRKRITQPIPRPDPIRDESERIIREHGFVNWEEKKR